MAKGATLVLAMSLAACADPPSAREKAPAPSSPRPPAPPPTELPEEDAAAESGMEKARKGIAELGRSAERLCRPITVVTEHPVSKDREAAFREQCFRQDGKPVWRGGWAPFYCDDTRPSCDEHGCMEGLPLFVVYQVPAAAMY